MFRYKFFLIICATIFAIFLGEILVRQLADKLMPSLIVAKNVTEGFAPTERRPSIFLGYEAVPNIEGRNSYGIYGPEDLRKPEGTYRILCLGDSVTDYPHFRPMVEDFLNKHRNNFPGIERFELWSAALEGYNILQYTQYVKYYAAKFYPDLIMINFCLNDLDAVTYVRYVYKNKIIAYGYSLVDKKWWMNDFLSSKSMLYRIIAFRLSCWLNRDIEKTTEYEQRISELFNEIKITSIRLRVPVMAVIYPYVKPYNDYDPDQMEDYRAIKINCVKSGFAIADLHDKFNELLEDYPLMYFMEDPGDLGDFLHFDIHKFMTFVVPLIYKEILEIYNGRNI